MNWKPLLIACLLVGGASSCTMNWVDEPLPEGFYQLSSATVEAPAKRAWVGLEVTWNEADSLESLDVQPGVRVTEVAPGSPGESAGIRVGDVLLRFDGTQTDDPDRLQQLLDQISEPQSVELEVQRGDQVLGASLEVLIREQGGMRPLYWVDRSLLRAAFRIDPGSPYPVVHQLIADSPLAQEKVRPGDAIILFQGRDPGSPAEMIRRVRQNLEPGSEFSMTIRRPNGRELSFETRAWAPESRLQNLGLWPLFSWDRDFAENREDFQLGDLIILSVFRVQRVGSVKKWSVLGLLSWQTGRPTLQTLDD